MFWDHYLVAESVEEGDEGMGEVRLLMAGELVEEEEDTVSGVGGLRIEN